jgi:hypothetical protein
VSTRVPEDAVGEGRRRRRLRGAGRVDPRRLGGLLDPLALHLADLLQAEQLADPRGVDVVLGWQHRGDEQHRRDGDRDRRGAPQPARRGQVLRGKLGRRGRRPAVSRGRVVTHG